jgi:hypothetical protein
VCTAERLRQLLPAPVRAALLSLPPCRNWKLDVVDCFDDRTHGIRKAVAATWSVRTMPEAPLLPGTVEVVRAIQLRLGRP